MSRLSPPPLPPNMSSPKKIMVICGQHRCTPRTSTPLAPPDQTVAIDYGADTEPLPDLVSESPPSEIFTNTAVLGMPPISVALDEHDYVSNRGAWRQGPPAEGSTQAVFASAKFRDFNVSTR
ncbi:hypothetical protein C8R47DRAFT_1222288 [Mycena vitilis]|nr:hypothetical protein C8R47DRAFT_1222288 [Mycena vitilis]